jgi:hypothetical protein
MKARDRIGRVAVAMLLAAGVVFTAGAAPHVDRITIVDALDSGYHQLPIPPEVRVRPDAMTRLLVLRDGGILMDLGLRDEHEITQPEIGDGEVVVEERGIRDEGHVAHDGRTAVLVSTEFVVRRQPDEEAGGGATTDRLVNGEASLTWIDADHPGGRWTVSFGGGRLVALVYVFAGGRGVMVTTTGGYDGRPDLRVLGPDGRPLVHLEELSSVRPAIDPTPSDLFLAADVSFISRPGRPDRGLLVLDMLRGYHWIYSWSYGSEDEPLSWELSDTGAVSIEVPGKTLRYDRLGRRVENR